MTRARKIYVSAMLGALGGVVAALIHRDLFVGPLSTDLAPRARLLLTAAMGASAGAALGFFPSFAEGMSRHRFDGALRSGLLGALLGALGGSLLGPLELLYRESSGGIPYRAAALALLGLALGATEALTGRTRWWRGLAGGAVGGLIAGVLVELLLASRNDSESDAAVWAFIVIGFCIALFVAIFVNLLTEAWLEGYAGAKVKGQVYQLSQFRHPKFVTLGSAKDSFIWLAGTLPAQATLSVTHAGTRLQNLGAPGEVRVDGQEVRGSTVLKDGQKIEIGTAGLRYRERKATPGAGRAAQAGSRYAKQPSAAGAPPRLQKPLPTPQTEPVASTPVPLPTAGRPRISVRDNLSEPARRIRVHEPESTRAPERHIRVRPHTADSPDKED